MAELRDDTCRLITVTGRVQGVGFRAWTADRARALGLSGWVRNRPDGTVEAQAQGPAAAVEALLERLRQGPPAARVDEVGSRAATPGANAGFTIRHD